MSGYKNVINFKKFMINIILPTFSTVLLFIVLIFGFILPYFEQSMLNNKKEMIRELVNTASGIAAKYENEAALGLITTEEAKTLAISRIGSLRYGIDSKDYFWITDRHPNMIMHPYRSDLKGKDLTDVKDANGTRLFVSMVQKVNSSGGEGYVDYMWQWMDDSSHVVPKISFVKEFRNWEWIIGTGIYIEDVRKEIYVIKNRLTLVSLAIFTIMSLLLAVLVRQHLRVEIKRNQAEEELRLSKEKYKALVEASTEGTCMVLEGKCIYSNKKFQEILGPLEHRTISTNFREIISPMNKADIERIGDFYNSELNYLQMETRLSDRSSHQFSVILSISKVTLSDKRGLIVTVKDLTIENSEKENSEAGRDLINLVDSVNLGTFKLSLSRKGRFIDINDHTAAILGYASRQELYNTNIFDLIEDPDEGKRFLSELNSKRKLRDFTLRANRKDGTPVILSVSLAAENDEEKGTGTVYGIMEDVTQRKCVESMKDELLAEIQSQRVAESQPVKNLLKNTQSCEMHTSVKTVAEIMAGFRTDSILIRSGNDTIGIITSADILNRVAAANADTGAPAFEFMSSPVITISDSSSYAEAVALMQKHNIHHLAVTDHNGEIAGILSKDDLYGNHHNTFDSLTAAISNAASDEEIRKITMRLPVIINSLIEGGAKSHSLARFVTSVSDVITERLAELAIKELGAPPVPFAFIALGSEGRSEQSLITDQDNAIIYECEFPEMSPRVQEYFLRFGKRICTMLDIIGYPFCKGDIMAMNPKWNQPLSVWKKYFTEWISKSEPHDLVDVSTFFDFRCIYGSKDLVQNLREHINSILSKNEAFFGQLARVCVTYKMPLSIFGKIQTEDNEEHMDSINIKNASRVIVNIVRLYSIKNGFAETNTISRLQSLYQKNIFSTSFYNDLVYSFDYLMLLQLKSQAASLLGDRKADHYIKLADLSNAEINMLKYIFSQVGSFQSKVKFDFHISE